MKLFAYEVDLRATWLVLSAMCCLSCRNHKDAGTTAVVPAGEPEVYSATVVQIAVNGDWREESTTKVERREDWRREEWTEDGIRRAQIVRPDLGKGYLLDLDNRLYMEFDYGGSAALPVRTGDSATPQAIDPLEVDRAIADTGPARAPAPAEVKTRTLPDQTIQAHLCEVLEESADLANGRVELTRSFRARDLSGLPLLIEIQSPGGAKLTIERRDIRLEAPSGDFEVPADFKRTELPHSAPRAVGR